MEAPGIIPELPELPELKDAFKRYESALNAVEIADRNLLADQALDVLLARDALQTIQAELPLESTPQMAQLIELDHRLQQQRMAISTMVPLEKWRHSRQPDEDAWWWFFQSETEAEPWDRYDWIWNGLAAGALALAASFMIGIYKALSVGGLSWGETFTTILQGAGLALVGQGALTATGKQKVQLALAYFKIPPQFYSETTCAFAMALLLITFGLHVYLPKYFYAKGQAFYEQGNLRDAEEKFIQGQSIAPDNPSFNIALGTIYESLGALDKALSHYQQSLQDGVTRAFNDIGRVYVQRFDPVKKRTEPVVAETYLRMGLQRAKSDSTTDPNTTFQLHRNLGWVLMNQKRYAEAKAEFEKALARDSASAGQQAGRGMESCFLAWLSEQQGGAENALAYWRDCRDRARPGTINEYKWFLEVGQRQLANCIWTSGIVTGVVEPPKQRRAACHADIEQLLLRSSSADAQLETLRVKLHDRLNRYWNGSDKLEEELVYRVSVGSNGAITAYEPLNQPASEHAQSTPLPTLIERGNPPPPLANFKVVLRPAGAFNVSLLD